MGKFSGVDKSIIARGVVYAVAGVVIVVGMFLGLVDGGEGSAWLERVPELAGLLGVVLAGSNLHRGSNSRVTEGDVEALAAGSLAQPAGWDVEAVREVVESAVADALERDVEPFDESPAGSVFPGSDGV